MTPPPAGAAVPDLPDLSSLSPLGRGGFADVYLAHQVHLDRWVAAKVFRVALADRRASDQFRAECQAVGRLDGHPNVIRVFEASVLPDGRPYMVTEHCDGSLLTLLTANGRLPPSRVVDIGLTVARALLFAHSARVLHGDVTPQNILLRASGAPVLADFGLAVLRDYQGNTATGFTMAHAAPETVRHDGAIDERTDVYGLGSTLYTALTGRPPFPARPGEDDAAQAHRILTETPAEPAGAPPELSRLLSRMLAKDPADRPSMNGVADALAALQDNGFAAPAASGTTGPGAAWAPPAGGGPAPGGAVDPELGPSYLAPGSGHGSATPVAWDGGPRSYAAASDVSVGSGAFRGPAAGSTGDTRNRPGPAFAPPPTADGGDPTRLRPRPDAEPATTRPPRRRRWVPIAVVAGVVLLAGVGAAVFRPWSNDAVPPGQAPAAGAAIVLAPPVDRGDSVDLTWTSDVPLDYVVFVGQQGQPEPRSEMVRRVTAYTAAVEPGRPYCFQVQGANSTGALAQSNVVSVRGAVCRFD